MASVQGVVPQQAVHITVQKSWNDVSSDPKIDPAHHGVEDSGSKFLGILPDGAIFSRVNENDKQQHISVQTAGLCSACINFAEDADPEKYDSYIGRLVEWESAKLKLVGVDPSGSVPNRTIVAKIVAVLEAFPNHPQHYHCVIHLMPFYLDSSARPRH